MHIACVVVSIAGFIARFAMYRFEAAALKWKTVRVLPHINDTVLLAAAIAMVTAAGINPFAAPWLIAKMLGLVAYVVLGIIAFRPSRGGGANLAAFWAALVVFAWIVSVAVLHDPWGLLMLAHAP